MPYRENADQDLRGKKSIECNVAGFAVGNYELAQFSSHFAADQRMICQRVDGFADDAGRGGGCDRVMLD